MPLGHPNHICIEEAPALDSPREIRVGAEDYFLCRDESDHYLLSAACPHRGGKVEMTEVNSFVCPVHGWKFDRSGRSTNVDSQELNRIPLSEKDGALFMDHGFFLDRRFPLQPPTRAAEVRVRLHSHACVEIEYRGFSLLTDPWLDGPAYFGAWIQYPKPVVFHRACDIDESAHGCPP